MAGISNVITINMTDILPIGNFTDPMGFYINVDQTVYGGILFFVLLCVLWAILTFALQDRNDDLLLNIMLSGAIVSILSMFLRAIYITNNGIVEGLLTDFQLWIFPLLTLIIAAIVWATKDR